MTTTTDTSLHANGLVLRIAPIPENASPVSKWGTVIAEARKLIGTRTCIEFDGDDAEAARARNALYGHRALASNETVHIRHRDGMLRVWLTLKDLSGRSES